MFPIVDNALRGRLIYLRISIFLVLISLCLSVRALEPGMIASLDGNATVSIEASHQFASVFLDTDVYSSNFLLEPAASDIGKNADIYLVAQFNTDWYMKTETDWVPWDTNISTLVPTLTKVLSSTEEIEVLNGVLLPPGHFEVYSAYKTEGESMVPAPETLRFNVQSTQIETLQRFSSETAMEAYLKSGMTYGSTSSSDVFDVVISEASNASLASASTRASTTNVQEVGVDEADIVKTDGEKLFALQSCNGEACLGIYDLNADQATADEIAIFSLNSSESSVIPNGMYFIEDDEQGDQLVTISGQNQYIYWSNFRGWAGKQTDIEFFDASNLEALTSVEKLSFDGNLISSRRIEDTLYIVTRFTPTVEGYYPYANDEETVQENEELLTRTSLADILPKAIDSRDEVLDLVSSQDCYLSTGSVDESRNPSIITIISIPLAAPLEFTSSCFLGASESIYMTTDSLYLATTQDNYSWIGFDALVYKPNHTTAIHKFNLLNGGVEYRGSGQVEGHLGWIEDKKSFRMGENGDYLNIVTSVGDTWNETSSTRLTVLKESDFSDELEEVSSIEGIGKPGEQLYAARFLGDRAYLVTFRIIDPLYVLDLVDQENPQIVGELEIEGYSEYLHPISENLLLGIGKDAIADDSSSDFSGRRGAWYQGVKLALFDVSDPTNPEEIDSEVLGKRGSESAVLWDHHAFTFLPAVGSEPARIAIPVQLHETLPSGDFFDPDEPGRVDYWH